MSIIVVAGVDEVFTTTLGCLGSHGTVLGGKRIAVMCPKCENAGHLFFDKTEKICIVQYGQVIKIEFGYKPGYICTAKKRVNNVSQYMKQQFEIKIK